jgi:hypothetical protein
MSKKGERKEALMRIIVAIVSGIILSVWRYLLVVFVLINFLYALFAGKRLKRIAELSEIWNSQFYDYIQYLTFVTNKRPFPFNDLRKNLTKFR